MPRLGAAAGVSFNETLRKLGIFEDMKPKIKIAPGGAGAMALLAKGDVDLGFTFISEIVTEPGVEVVGPPAARHLDRRPQLVAFVSAHSKEPEAREGAREASSRHPRAAAVYKARGMVPAAAEPSASIQRVGLFNTRAGIDDEKSRSRQLHPDRFQDPRRLPGAPWRMSRRLVQRGAFLGGGADGGGVGRVILDVLRNGPTNVTPFTGMISLIWWMPSIGLSARDSGRRPRRLA